MEQAQVIASKAASLASGLLMFAHFNVLTCSEILRKRYQDPHRTQSSIRKSTSVAYLPEICTFQTSLSSADQQQNYYEESFYIAC